MPTFLRIDETPTEQENDKIVEADETLRGHLELIHTGFDLLPAIIKHVVYKNDAELAFTRRCCCPQAGTVWLLSAIAFDDP